MGGFQQARAASLGGATVQNQFCRAAGTQCNWFYMEGSIEFLDHEGEWHFDPTSRRLTVFPPEGIRMQGSELLLTQTDTLFELVGSSSDPGSRVENIILSGLSFRYTSAQYFRPRTWGDIWRRLCHSPLGRDQERERDECAM